MLNKLNKVKRQFILAIFLSLAFIFPPPTTAQSANPHLNEIPAAPPTVAPPTAAIPQSEQLVRSGQEYTFDALNSLI